MKNVQIQLHFQQTDSFLIELKYTITHCATMDYSKKKKKKTSVT